MYPLFIAIVISWWIQSCGSSEFQGTTSTQPYEAPAVPVIPPELAISWVWPCSGSDPEDQQVDDIYEGLVESSDHIILEGAGPHSIPYDRAHGASVQMRGSPCNLESKRRNVVIIVDVSGSMGAPMPQRPDVTFANDVYNPRTLSCERMHAVSTIIDSIKRAQKDSRFSLITFSDPHIHSSSQFFENKRAAFRDFTSGHQVDIGQLVCAAEGGTHYGNPLAKASELVEKLDRKTETSEIYFISDGAPTNPVWEHRALAGKLKLMHGTQIATVMVGPDVDTELRNFLASKDDQGQPIHARVDNINKLSSALEQFTKNMIKENLLYYGSGEERESLDFGKDLKGSRFDFKAFKLDTRKHPTGMDVEFRYVDRFDQVISKFGFLEW